MTKLLRAGALLLLLFGGLALGQGPVEATAPYTVFVPMVRWPKANPPTPTPTATLTSTRTSTLPPTATRTSTATATKTATMTPTAEGTPSDTATPSPTVTSSPTAIGGCPVISSETYSTLSVNPPPTDRPAAQHADLNLALRSYIGTTGYLGLVDISGPTDSNAPQLYNLFGDKRTGVFTSLSQVYDWNWATNSRGAPITDPAVTLARLAMAVGEAVHVPGSGYTIGTPSLIPAPGTAFLKTDLLAAAGGYEVLVLYAATNRITLKYTRDDNVIHGYTLHVEDVCVEPRLLALYQQMNTAGRAYLPALRAGQSFGTARTTSIGAAIRDSGSFMEPRSRKDWWQGR